MGTQATGAARLTPEQLANKLITSAGNETAQRFTELNNAMDFIIQKQPDPTLKAEMRALKNTIYRALLKLYCVTS